MDALTQKDVDSLLRGGSSPAVADRNTEVLPYDFLRPPRISRDRRATLEGIYGRFALAMQPLLASRLRQPADVTVASVEQATFGEFSFSLGNPCAAFVFDLGSGVHGVLDLSTEFSYYLVDRMFGGPGEAQGLPRPLTPLERLTVRGVTDRVLTLLGEVWQDHMPFAPVQVGFEASPEALQIANKEDNVLVANIELRAGGFSGVITVCIPLHALEAFLQEKPAAVRQGHRASPAQQAIARADIETGLKVAHLAVSARLPMLSLRARDVAALKVGQIIQTGLPTDVPLELHVNGRRRFFGAAGQVRSAMGLRITHVCDSGHTQPHGRTSPARVV